MAGIEAIPVYSDLGERVRNTDEPEDDPLTDDQVCRPFTTSKAEKSFKARPDPEDEAQWYQLQDGEPESARWVRWGGKADGETEGIYVPETNAFGEVLYNPRTGNFFLRGLTAEEAAEDDRIGALPAFTPAEQKAFAAKFKEVWGKEPSEFSSKTITLFNADELSHAPLFMMGTGFEIYLESTGEAVKRHWHPGFSPAFTWTLDPATNRPLEDPANPGDYMRVRVQPTDQVGCYQKDGKLVGISKKDLAQDIQRATSAQAKIDAQRDLRKEVREGRVIDHAISENMALAPIAHILTTGHNSKKYIITSTNPPKFGCPTGKPVMPKLKEFPMSVQEPIGCLFDNSSVRASKFQGLKGRSGNIVYLRCSTGAATNDGETDENTAEENMGYLGCKLYQVSNRRLYRPSSQEVGYLV
jgi:hypothetical protein